MAKRGLIPESAERTMAVRRAYDGLTAEEQRKVDLLCEDVRTGVKLRQPRVGFGFDSALELLGKLGLFLAEEGT